MIEEKLQQGIIEQSSAPWSSNCVCIRKDGKTRIAVDYRKLNQITVRDNYLLPKISEVLDTLGGCQWFTSADAAQAYHQIPMGSDRDKDLTTFVSPSGGLYRYRAMPFGLANAGAVWSRFIDGAMGGLRWNVCCVYADDILCFSRGKSVDEHIRHLDQIFERLDKFGITVKGSKLQLGAKELPFLGQIISTEGFKPNPTKIKAVVDLEAPTNVAQLRKIMGMFAHYAKYIPGFSQIAAPLYELTRKGTQNKRDANRRIEFGERQLASFQKLKTCLTTEPIMLAFPREGCPYEIHCDASEVGIAAILIQKVEGEEKVLMYASAPLTKSELNYIPYQKECLAVHWAVLLFHHYISRERFVVRSDCKALEWLKTGPLTDIVTKWHTRLQHFDFEVVHRPGAKSQNVDGLTRQPILDASCYGVDPLPVLDNIKPRHITIRPVSTRSRLGGKGGKQARQPESLLAANPAADEEPVEEEEHKDAPATNKTDSASKPGAREEEAPDVQPPRVEIDADTSEEEGEEEQDTPSTTFFECKEEKEGWEIETWISEQALAEKETDVFKKMFKRARNRGDTRFTISKGLLVKIESEERRRPEGRREKVVVPESLKAFVLGQHHNLELHGHQGRRRTEIMIGARYYWPGMSKDIRRWILACSGCSKRKKARPMGAGLTEINQATRPWQTVGIDIVGKLPLTSNGNKWILTMVDHFTRWPIAIPIPDRESATIAKAIFDNLVTVHGPPQTILSDQGRELISKGMEALCSRWGIKKVKTGGYNPTGNANCERFHKYLNSSMTIIRNRQTPSDWDEYLQAVLFSYRCSVNDATGYSPYFLLNGRTPTIPSDLSFDILETEYKSKEDYVQKMIERLRTAFSLARRQQYAAAVENEDRGGDKSKPDYKPGDLLFVWARSSEESRTEKADGKKTTLPKKWVNPWIGPYRLIRWTSERKCLLDCAGKEQEFIVNRLSKHNRWDEVNPSTYAWSLKEKSEEKDKPAEEKEIEISPPKEEREIFGRDYVFKKGEMIVFEQLESEAYNIPFGLGVVMDHKKGKLVEFQWMGNSGNNEKGKWDLCWYQENEAKIYYSSKPLHKNHTPNTGVDTETRIKPDDVIMSSRGKTDILHLDKTKDSSYRRITSVAKKVIEDNPYVMEARLRMQNKKLKQTHKSAADDDQGRRKRKGEGEKHSYPRKK